MAPYEAIYERRCRSPIGWFGVCEAGLMWQDVVHQAIKKVKLFKRVWKWHKFSISPTHMLGEGRYTLKWMIGCIWRSHAWKVIWGFAKRVNLVPGILVLIDSKRVQCCIWVSVTTTVQRVHLVFHLSMLKKWLGDPSLIVPNENFGIKDSLSNEEVPTQILDRQVLHPQNEIR